MNPLNHVAIIMDGNGRWGLKYRNSRNVGHKEGLKTVETIIRSSIKNKIKLYSTKKNLFKPDKFTKNLEKSYKMIYENYLNDHNPKEIEL